MKQNNPLSLDKLLMLAGILTLPFFFILFFLIFPLMYPGYNLLIKGVSYLGGLQSPIRTIVNVFGFSLWGILTMIFGYGVFRSKLLGISGKIAGIFLVIGGFMIYLVGIFQGPTTEGIYTMGGELHNFFANYPFVPIAIAFFLFLFEFLVNKKFRWLILPIIILGPISLYLSYYRAFTNSPIPYFGIVQRTALVVPYLVIMLIAIALYRAQNKNKFNSELK